MFVSVTVFSQEADFARQKKHNLLKNIDFNKKVKFSSRRGNGPDGGALAQLAKVFQQFCPQNLWTKEGGSWLSWLPLYGTFAQRVLFAGR